MATSFFDTSALAKQYVTEPGSPRVRTILADPSSVVWVSRLGAVELHSLLAKKVRTGEIAVADFHRLRLRFLADIGAGLFQAVRITPAHLVQAQDRIVHHGPTRKLASLDAIQLATALGIRTSSSLDHFVSADANLCSIVALEGLPVINPEVP